MLAKNLLTGTVLALVTPFVSFVVAFVVAVLAGGVALAFLLSAGLLSAVAIAVDDGSIRPEIDEHDEHGGYVITPTNK